MKKFKNLFLSVALFAAPIAYAQDEFEVLIPRYEWPGEVSADVVLQIPQIRRAVSRLLKSEHAELIVRYPGGDAGNQWALDLRAMLISLGIESRYIVLEPGSGIDETMVLLVTPKRGQ